MIISTVVGSLVENGNTDVHEDHINREESPNHDQNELSTLSDVASSWVVELGGRQFIALKVICFSFFFILS